MRPYEAYWLHKQASDGVDWHALRQKTHDHLHAAQAYWQANKPAMLRSTANNLMYGLLTSRATGPVSLVGSSTGGVIDGMLFRPATDATINLVGTGLRKFYGLGEK
jgi:hypothetical protein